jgi:hypothetical protein
VETNDFDQFPEDIRDAVDGLAWLGHLQDTVHMWGHSFTLQTLKAGEELEAALIAKEYQDSFGQVKAHAWAHLAMSVVAIDGDQDFCPPIGPDIRKHAEAKFRYMTENWYWPIGEYLFGKYVDLVQRQSKALEALEDLSPGSRQTSRPTQDSLTEQADSEGTSTDSNSDSLHISPEEMMKIAQEAEKSSSKTSY